MPKIPVIAAMVLFSMLVAGCAGPAAPPLNNTTAPPGNNSSGIPNPASEFCNQHNGTLKIQTGPEGEFGVCTFADGAKCEEWAYYRGECSPSRPNYCEHDTDCSCGVHAETRDCFYGQKEFVDPLQQCPDFCNGIAAHLEIVCIDNQCKQRMRDRCADYGVEACPAGCAVCPPCAECSSIKCQSEASCEALGFGKGWYESVGGGN